MTDSSNRSASDPAPTSGTKNNPGINTRNTLRNIEYDCDRLLERLHKEGLTQSRTDYEAQLEKLRDEHRDQLRAILIHQPKGCEAQSHQLHKQHTEMLKTFFESTKVSAMTELARKTSLADSAPASNDKDKKDTYAPVSVSYFPYSAIQEDYERRLERVLKHHGDQVRAEYEEQMKQVRVEHENQLEQVHKEHEDQMRRVRKVHEEQLSQLRHSHASQLQNLAEAQDHKDDTIRHLIKALATNTATATASSPIPSVINDPKKNYEQRRQLVLYLGNEFGLGEKDLPSMEWHDTPIKNVEDRK